jgi:hypothetical protein
LKFRNSSLFTGLEGGYITFNTMNVADTIRVKGTGYEVSPFFGLEYFFVKRVSFMLDFSMPIINVTHQDVSLSGIQWVTSGAIYFYPF